ncbi:hypothetical protein NKH16_26430 [Mesorhizobium sp. M1307]|uniref:hypothetical protein n=1 Tax=Mesorhizobium sp. M1307 TaxID=2957079 RepID=UPI0033383D67
MPLKASDSIALGDVYVPTRVSLRLEHRRNETPAFSVAQGEVQHDREIAIGDLLATEDREIELPK